MGRLQRVVLVVALARLPQPTWATNPASRFDPKGLCFSFVGLGGCRDANSASANSIKYIPKLSQSECEMACRSHSVPCAGVEYIPQFDSQSARCQLQGTALELDRSAMSPDATAESTTPRCHLRVQCPAADEPQAPHCTGNDSRCHGVGKASCNALLLEEADCNWVGETATTSAPTIAIATTTANTTAMSPSNLNETEGGIDTGIVSSEEHLPITTTSAALGEAGEVNEVGEVVKGAKHSTVTVAAATATTAATTTATDAPQSGAEPSVSCVDLRDFTHGSNCREDWCTDSILAAQCKSTCGLCPISTVASDSSNGSDTNHLEHMSSVLPSNPSNATASTSVDGANFTMGASSGLGSSLEDGTEPFVSVVLSTTAVSPVGVNSGASASMAPSVLLPTGQADSGIGTGGGKSNDIVMPAMLISFATVAILAIMVAILRTWYVRRRQMDPQNDEPLESLSAPGVAEDECAAFDRIKRAPNPLYRGGTPNATIAGTDGPVYLQPGNTMPVQAAANGIDSFAVDQCPPRVLRIIAEDQSPGVYEEPVELDILPKVRPASRSILPYEYETVAIGPPSLREHRKPPIVPLLAYEPVASVSTAQSRAAASDHDAKAAYEYERVTNIRNDGDPATSADRRQPTEYHLGAAYGKSPTTGEMDFLDKTKTYHLGAAYGKSPTTGEMDFLDKTKTTSFKSTAADGAACGASNLSQQKQSNPPVTTIASNNCPDTSAAVDAVGLGSGGGGGGGDDDRGGGECDGGECDGAHPELGVPTTAVQREVGVPATAAQREVPRSLQLNVARYELDRNAIELDSWVGLGPDANRLLAAAQSVKRSNPVYRDSTLDIVSI